MNEVKLSGKVLKAFIDDNGFFVCTVAVLHEHTINGFTEGYESIIRCHLADKIRSQEMAIFQGDRVIVNGYLRQDRRLSATGQERKALRVYIKDIELIKES